MKIAIVGDVEYKYLDRVREYVATLEQTDEIVSGGAPGVDTEAEQTADKRGMKKKIFAADWTRYGKAAGPIRNKQIVAYADRVVAFWNGRGKGTKNDIDLTRKARKPLLIIYEDGATRSEEPAQQMPLW